MSRHRTGKQVPVQESITNGNEDSNTTTQRISGKQTQESTTNGNEDSDATTQRILEKRVAQKRKYNSTRYQEMSEEKKQAIQMRRRARYQQLRTGDSSNNPIPNSTASSNVLLVSESALQIDVGSSTPHDATEPLHGVRTSRKRIYNDANTQPPVTTQNDSEDTIQKGECNYHSNSSNPSFNGAGHDPYDFLYHGLPPTPHLLKAPTSCTYCGAKKFQYEFPTFCCMNGKTKLASSEIPNALYYLFTTRDRIGVEFRHSIRSYNTHFSFTSFGVKYAKRKNSNNYGGGVTNEESNCGGVYNFRVHGQIYHFIDQLLPREGRLPEYLQLYFYDTESEVDHRVQRMPSLDRNVVEKLMVILSNNPYSQMFRSLGELQALDTCGITLNASVVELDQRVYNKPSASQVAAVWVEGNGDNSAFKRSIVVFGRSDRPQIVNYYFGCYDPLAYTLFFANGEVGWHPKIPRVGVSIDSITEECMDDGDEAGQDVSRRRGRNTVSAREYYCYKLQIRSEPNLLLLGGRLLQQFVVDMYIKVETSRLDYVLQDQVNSRKEILQGIVDSVTAGESRAHMIGQRIVLPSSFIGGPRDMRRRFMDAMALVTRFGHPDIFLTMTCNPAWEEIHRELLPGQQPQDRPDLIGRVFRAKLEDLRDLLFKKNFFGAVASRVHVIEFQKRGLPHAHFLIILQPSDKITNRDMYDKFVSAEIPPPQKYPELHKLVVKHMLHGPCGALQAGCPCMKNGKCRFSYPKQFSEITVQGKDSYPVYRRRNNGRQVQVRGSYLDNRWVVPYNPHLLMRYNCHINVEVCSSIQAVKYLFKYIYKGHDRAAVAVEPATEENHVNEIKQFQDARWVSAPEAMWRLFGFALSEINPSVRSLWLHLPNEQTVHFAENQNLYDLTNDESAKKTMLTEFFATNQTDLEARSFLYREFPEHFTWNSTRKKWTKRQRGGEVGRVVSANPEDGDRYYLRILLNHVRGPTSFAYLLTFHGVLHKSFHASAEARGLIEDDSSISNCLSEAATFQSPSALRRLFATILVYCEPGNVQAL